MKIGEQRCMRVLQVSPQSPSNKSGGEIGVLQTLDSLCKNEYCIDYVGPEIRDKVIKEKYNYCIELEQDSKKIRRLFYLLHGITNSRYKAWKNLLIDLSKYDVIVMDFTKLDYVLSRIKDKPLVVKVHNVEYDYSNNDYEKNKSLLKWIIAKLSYKQEKVILRRANSILVLTENDKERIGELYGSELESKILLNPVSLSIKKIEKKKKENPLKLLITGSLWYGENVNGVLWFLQNVFSKLNVNVELIVAGAKPNENLKTEVKKYKNVRLIDTPITMEPYFRECDLFIAPIFCGAGMKVKVAEALSYGKPVLGTDHALLGYEISEKVNSFRANTQLEFIEQIEEIAKMNADKWKQIVDNAEALFYEKYSISNSAIQWKKAIENAIK